MSLEVADDTVNLEHLDPGLVTFLQSAGTVHMARYGKPLTITSANDGRHAAGSKHYSWKAVDLRSRELSLPEQRDFGAYLVSAAYTFHVGVFDERFIGKPHWHVEAA